MFYRPLTSTQHSGGVRRLPQSSVQDEPSSAVSEWLGSCGAHPTGFAGTSLPYDIRGAQVNPRRVSSTAWSASTRSADRSRHLRPAYDPGRSPCGTIGRSTSIASSQRATDPTGRSQRLQHLRVRAPRVERGEAPNDVTASRVEHGKVVRTRPLCPYPQVAIYRGSGSTDGAKNFVCR